VISSNHFPVLPKYKFSVGDNFFKALSGISSIGMTLPAVWTSFNQNRISLVTSTLDKEK